MREREGEKNYRPHRPMPRSLLISVSFVLLLVSTSAPVAASFLTDYMPELMQIGRSQPSPLELNDDFVPASVFTAALRSLCSVLSQTAKRLRLPVSSGVWVGAKPHFATCVIVCQPDHSPTSGCRRLVPSTTSLI